MENQITVALEEDVFLSSSDQRSHMIALTIALWQEEVENRLYEREEYKHLYGLDEIVVPF